LFHFLSFCRGAWVAPMLAVGFDDQDAVVWREWRNWKISAWKDSHCWLNDFSENWLREVFPGFLRRWTDDTWKEPIRHAIHWYIESNMCAGGIEGSIILEQAAFELLAWTLLAADLKILSEEALDPRRLPAADKLRLLLANNGIPLAIPASLADLQTAASTEQTWVDGPKAITELRNGLIHPSPQRRRKVFSHAAGARHDAWCLGLWYLELSLLRIFEYHGLYANRLMRDGFHGQQMMPVPWAEPNSQSNANASAGRSRSTGGSG